MSFPRKLVAVALCLGLAAPAWPAERTRLGPPAAPEAVRLDLKTPERSPLQAPSLPPTATVESILAAPLQSALPAAAQQAASEAGAAAASLESAAAAPSEALVAPNAAAAPSAAPETAVPETAAPEARPRSAFSQLKALAVAGLLAVLGSQTCTSGGCQSGIPPPAPAPQAISAVERAELLMRENDPSSAEILKDQAFFTRLRDRDPDLAARLFTQKALLDALDSATAWYEDAGSLRRELRAEFKDMGEETFSGLGLGPEPEKLSSWVNDNYDAKEAALFSKALWSWATLPPELSAWLTKMHGLTEGEWDHTGFPEREAMLREWALPERDAIMRTPAPWTPAQERRILEKSQTVIALLHEHAEIDPLAERLNQALLLRAGLERWGGTAFPAPVKAQLARARDASLAMGDRIDALTRVARSPQAGYVNPAYLSSLDRWRSARPAELLTADQITRLEKALPQKYLDYVAEVGTSLASFYKDHKLTLRVTPPFPGSLAEYDPDLRLIKFNVREIETWLRQNRRAAEDLFKDPSLMDEFIRETAPVFYHETIHQWQFESLGLELMNHHQPLEEEAMFRETVFLVNASAKSPWTLNFMRTQSQTSVFAQSYLQLWNALAKGGDAFRREVASNFYPGFPSVAGMAGALTRHFERNIEELGKGIAGRPDASSFLIADEEMDEVYQGDFLKACYVWSYWFASHSTRELQALSAAFGREQEKLSGLYVTLDERWAKLRAEMDDFSLKTWHRPALRP